MASGAHRYGDSDTAAQYRTSHRPIAGHSRSVRDIAQAEAAVNSDRPIAGYSRSVAGFWDLERGEGAGGAAVAVVLPAPYASKRPEGYARSLPGTADYHARSIGHLEESGVAGPYRGPHSTRVGTQTSHRGRCRATWYAMHDVSPGDRGEAPGGTTSPTGQSRQAGSSTRSVSTGHHVAGA
eukprot:2258739-Rhodomonas_salina.3